MTKLRRTYSAGFDESDCVTLEQLAELAGEDKVASVIIPSERAFSILPKIYLGEIQARMLKNGVRLDSRRVRNCPESGRVAVFGGDGTFLAAAEVDGDTHEIMNVKLFCDRH